jgi:hypothetical protein
MSTKSRNSLMLAATASYVEKITTFAEELQIKFTDYQRDCVVNAVRTINPMIEKNGYNWQSFGVDNIITVLQQTAFLELNPSATPNECYYIVRKNYDKKTKSYLAPTLEFGIEGAGNDLILQKFGRDVVELKSYIVYEGDEFTEGFMDGWDMTLPKHRRMFLTNKPLKVVYLIKKTNGEIDVQYSDTQDVKKSLLANAKQNGAADKLLREINKSGLYDILESDKWLDYTIDKSYGSNTYKTPLFNPSYTSPISMYNMIERKLRNHATRKYPKNFNHKEVSVLYEDTFDEKYNKQGEVITAEEQVGIANKEFENESGTKPLEKVEKIVKVEPIEKVENDDRPALKIEETEVEEVVEKIVDSKRDKKIIGEFTENVVEKITVLKEELVDIAKEKEVKKQKKEPVQQSLDDDELPDWMK